MSGMTYILTTTKKVGDHGDTWDDLETDFEVFDHSEFDAAQEAYTQASEDDGNYIVTLAAVIDSTAYDTHPEMRLYSRG